MLLLIIAVIRWVDLRTPANQSIFRIQSGVCQLFREFLSSKGFIEVHMIHSVCNKITYYMMIIHDMT